MSKDKQYIADDLELQHAMQPAPPYSSSSSSYRYPPPPQEPVNGPYYPPNFNPNNETPKFITMEGQKRPYIDRICCGWFSCFPRWVRWSACIMILIVVVLAIAFGIVFGIFKYPTVQFTGITNTPTVTTDNNMVTVSFDLGFLLDNPNSQFYGIDKISTDLFYPSPYNITVASSELDNLKLTSHATSNLVFPIKMSLDTMNSTQKAVLSDISTRCGSGSINLNSNVYPRVHILGVPITLSLSQSLVIGCPLQGTNLTSILGTSA